MSRALEGAIPVLEYSPEGWRAVEPGSGRTITAASAAEALATVGSPRSVGLALSRRAAFVKTTRVPDAERADVAQVIKMQLGRIFPAMDADLAFDFYLTDDRSSEGRLAVVAAARADVLRSARQAIREAGAKVEWVQPCAFGSVPAIGSGSALLLDPTPEGLGIDVVQQGHVTYSRVAPGAGDVAGEAARTMAAARAEGLEMVVTDGMPAPEGARRIDHGALAGLAAGPRPALSIALQDEVLAAEQVVSRRRSRMVFLIGAAVVLVLAFIGIDRWDKGDEAGAASRKLQERVRSVEQDLSVVENRLATENKIAEGARRAFEPAQSPADVMTVIANSTPQGVWLTGATFDRGKPALVRGTALTNEAISTYLSRLEQEDRFRDVKLQFANNGDIDGKPVVQFSISVVVVGNLPLTEESRRGARR